LNSFKIKSDTCFSGKTYFKCFKKLNEYHYPSSASHVAITDPIISGSEITSPLENVRKLRGCGSSERTPALQAQSPEFKLQCH
jgi:hypothetical protein